MKPSRASRPRNWSTEKIQAVIDRAAENGGGVIIIPKGTYKGQDEDIATFGIKALLCVRADLDEDLVYEITSILYENRDRLKDLHPALSYTAQSGFIFKIRTVFVRMLSSSSLLKLFSNSSLFLCP